MENLHFYVLTANICEAYFNRSFHENIPCEQFSLVEKHVFVETKFGQYFAYFMCTPLV